MATEQAIAAAVEPQVARTDAAAVADVPARRAIAERENALGKDLTVGQRSAVLGITISGRGAELARPAVRSPAATRVVSPSASISGRNDAGWALRDVRATSTTERGRNSSA